MTRYRYHTKNDNGYRLSVEKSNLLYFKKIVYAGFNIKYSDTNTIEYEIEPQIIRKIKLNKINKQTNRTEIAILELLERSNEVDMNTSYNSNYGNSYWYSCSSSSSYNYDDEEIIENKQEIKNRNKLQSKIHSQKAKQYESKTRFRK